MHYFHQISFHLHKTCLIKCESRIDQFYMPVSSLIYVLAAQPRFLSSVNKELFHQSSFYLINSVSSVQLLFHQRYSLFAFFSGGKSPGIKCSRRKYLRSTLSVISESRQVRNR